MDDLRVYIEDLEEELEYEEIRMDTLDLIKNENMR